MSKAPQVGMAFGAAFACGRQGRGVSSPGCPLLFLNTRAGSLKPVLAVVNG